MSVGRSAVRGSSTRRSTAGILGLLGAAPVIAAALLLLPVAAAAGPITIAAPYVHAVDVGSTYTSTSGCDQIAAHPAHWLASTGVGHLYDHASVHHCPVSLPGLGTGSFAYGSSESVLAIPIKTFQGSARPTSVQVDWSLTENLSQGSTISGACPTVSLNAVTGNGTQQCDYGAEEYVDAGAYLVDVTTGTSYGANNAWAGSIVWGYVYNDTYCVAFTCGTYTGGASSGGNLSGTVSLSFWINATLSHYDHYEVVTWVDGLAYAYVDGYPHGVQTSLTDLANGGNQDDLQGIVVS